MIKQRPRSLDEWYIAVNRLYLDRNFYRHPESIFAHLVEIVGGLSLLASDKNKPGVNNQGYIAKALGWWFALCGKMRIRSVEEMIWSKFPGMCPYCRLDSHNNAKCKLIKSKYGHPDWTEIQKVTQDRHHLRPKSLGEWLTMFNRIYSVTEGEGYAITFARISEELGELAEATRLFQIEPGYFFSEASDFFAWLMHLQALYLDKTQFDGDWGKQLEDAIWKQYPGICLDCGNEICSCPPVLKKTLGRIAHDMPIITNSSATPLLGLSEAMEIFDYRSNYIHIGEHQFSADRDFVLDFKTHISNLHSELTKLFDQNDASQALLIQLLDKSITLGENHRITQSSIDELVLAVNNLSPGKRAIVKDYLLGIGASAWATALIEAGKLMI